MKRKYRVIKHIRLKHKYEYVLLVQMKIFLWWITVKEFEVQMDRFDSKQYKNEQKPQRTSCLCMVT